MNSTLAFAIGIVAMLGGAFIATAAGLGGPAAATPRTGSGSATFALVGATVLIAALIVFRRRL